MKECFKRGCFNFNPKENVVEDVVLKRYKKRATNKIKKEGKNINSIELIAQQLRTKLNLVPGEISDLTLWLYRYYVMNNITIIELQNAIIQKRKCPRCGETDFYNTLDNNEYKCPHCCRYTFNKEVKQ